MTLRRSIVFAMGLFFCPATSFSSSITTEVTANHQARSEDRASTWNAQNLYCQAFDDKFYRSKLVLIQTTSQHFDYALTTAHGIEKGQYDRFSSCFIRHSSGEKVNLVDVYIPDDYKAGTQSDWAVIKLEKVKQKHVARFKLHVEDSEQFSHGKSIAVTFPKARGINDMSQNCRAMSSAYLGVRNEQILAHNCRAIGGQSGSPVFVKYEAEDMLIGIHLGKSFVYRSPITRKPEYLGYFRVIDKDMIAEINHAVASFTQ